MSAETAETSLYDCPVCNRDPWNCTCLSKERVRRIAYVIGYPTSPKIADEAPIELVPAVISSR